MKVPFPNSVAGAFGAATIFASQLFTPAPMHAAVPISVPTTQITYETANDIPMELFENRGIIHGRVEKVIDGDTLRIRHYPNYPYQKQNEYNGKLYEHTITIRLYGIDAPEIAKNGNPGMAYANESKDYTMSKVNGKIVNVKVFKKDQYSRVLGKVMTDECYPIDSFSTMKVSTASPSAVCKPNYDYLDVSQGLAHNGLSTLYRGGGAEYDGNKNGLEKEIQFAQINKKGIWTNGVENAQSPAEYKRAMREANAK